jgi:hypothetical protein
MALKAGTKKRDASREDHYTGSMAQAMENAFIKEWPVIMGTDAPPINDHMRLLVVAIAQGVLRHLKDNQVSITFSMPPGGGDSTANIIVQAPLY